MTMGKWRARLRYEFDKSMAAGTLALIGWLGVASLLIVIVAGLFLVLSGITQPDQPRLGFAEAAWESLMRAMDAGTVGGDSGWAFRGVMLIVTLAGLFVVSALIGVLSAGLEDRLNELRKGRSLVLEQDHTIIFNWSPSIFDVISELVIANESRKRPRIVIMSDRDKVEMEDEIAAKVEDLRNTRIICRSGEPTDLHDIAIVNPQAAQSIIVLSPETQDADSRVIKTVLALVHDPARRAEPYRIAAELREQRNADIARVVGGAEVQLVLADDLIARIMVQSTRQPGLSAVFTELLDFDGCEIYTVAQPDLVGARFGDAILAYDDCTLIGLCDTAGRVMLNPPADQLIAEGMQAIIIAEDDDRIMARPIVPDAPEVAPVAGDASVAKAERVLILGWNRRGPIIAEELARYAAAGSLLTIAADSEDFAAYLLAAPEQRDGLIIEYRKVDTASAAQVAVLDPAGYDSVLVLGYSDTMAAQAADTRTLVTLLQLRSEAERTGRSISVVSEMIDVRNRALAEVTRVSDFVVSNKLVSLMLAQASENERVEAIFAELLDNDGVEICLRPVDAYASFDTETPFVDVVRAARARGEVAIGHRLEGLKQNDRKLGGVVINPTKSHMVRYGPADRIVILQCATQRTKA